MEKKLSELMTIKGLGAVKVTRIAAIFEATRRIVRTLQRGILR